MKNGWIVTLSDGLLQLSAPDLQICQPMVNVTQLLLDLLRRKPLHVPLQCTHIIGQLIQTSNFNQLYQGLCLITSNLFIFLIFILIYWVFLKFVWNHYFTFTYKTWLLNNNWYTVIQDVYFPRYELRKFLCFVIIILLNMNICLLETIK